MDLGNVNLVSWVVSAALAFGLGALWYSPLLFANPWMRLSGMDPETMRPTPAPFIIAALCWLVAAFVYGLIARSGLVTGILGLFQLSGLLWLGFALPPMAVTYAFTDKPKLLLAIDSGYHLGVFLVFAVAHAVLG